jgi:acyl carrier protein
VLTSYLRSQVATVLGWGSPAQLQPRQSLFDLGLDSLMTIELKNSLESGLGLTLSSTFIYDYPTIEGMVNCLSRTLLQADPDSHPTPDSKSDVVAKRLDWQGLEELSEPEAEALLLQELKRLKY